MILGIYILFLIIAIIIPFINYKEVKRETKENFSVDEYYSDSTGIDRAMLLETNTSAWEERLRLLSQAEERIILSTFDMRDGESTKDILSVILNRADNGVKVKILVDGVSGLIRMENKKIFYALSSHPNVEIKLYNRLNILQPWKSQGRMHDKYIIVDNYAYILGGRNTFDYFIGDYNAKSKSHDREVLIYNTAYEDKENKESSLYQVEEYFKGVWELETCKYFHNEEKWQKDEEVIEAKELLYDRYEKLVDENPELFNGCDYYDMTVETNAVNLISNPTGIYGKEPVVFYKLSELMKDADYEVIIHMPYAVCNDYMYETLSEISEIVPEIHMMINSVENGDNVMASSDYRKNKGKLIDTGIQILEYDGGKSYHGKSIVIDDDISIIGSYNLDLRSTYVDTELMLVIQSRELNSELREAMSGFEEDCRTVVDEKNYITPEHIEVAEVSFFKKAVWLILGIIFIPFRVLV